MRQLNFVPLTEECKKEPILFLQVQNGKGMPKYVLAGKWCPQVQEYVSGDGLVGDLGQITGYALPE